MLKRTKSTMTITLIYGTILAAIVIILSLVLSHIDLTMNLTVRYPSYVIIFGAIIAQLLYRKAYTHEDLTYGKAFTIGFMTVLFASLIYMIYRYISLKYMEGSVNPMKFYKETGWIITVGAMFSLFTANFTKTKADVYVDNNERRCSVCHTILIPKAVAVQTGNLNKSDRTCYHCGTMLCFGCAEKEGFMRRGLTKTLICPKCGANLNV